MKINLNAHFGYNARGVDKKRYWCGPDTVPPSSDLIWFMWLWIRPSELQKVRMLLMNVPDVLLRFRASTISLGNLSGCSDRNFFVKDGEPFSVLKYSMPILSKALAMDAAAQISMSQPEIRFISL